MKHLTDEEIMLQVANGNLDMLSILFDRYHVRIYNFFNKMLRDKMASEDLTQDVFIRVMKYRASYKQGNFTSWIYTIARNIFSTYYQNKKKEQVNISEEEIGQTDKQLITENNREELDYLQQALSKLKSHERELIVMHRFQEIKYSQIAEIIGSNENAVKVKVHRALKKLKDIYFQTIQ